MNAVPVQPTNKNEMELVVNMLKKMRIQTKLLSDEKIEDYGLIQLMKEVDRTKKVSREKVMQKLKQK